ncbi:MAG: hypothetical protein Ct9H300mP1_17760 [Planctomycetaceae bacterium]|nr:MAG: hypothetical protein Ct9H300mP1_17760 [Planctomycetaceae bacterium]
MTNQPNTTRFPTSLSQGAGGAALSPPWLESFTATACRNGGRPAPAKRLAFFYLPNGITRRGFFPGEGDRPLPKFAGQNNVWRFEGKTVPVGNHPDVTPTLAPLHKGFATRSH